MDTTKLTFSQWLAQVDALIGRKVGLTLQDLPEQDFRSYYAAQESPSDCFDHHLRGELEDLGFALEIADLFDQAQDSGRDLLAPHVLAEVRLDFITDEPFDFTDFPDHDEAF